MDDLVQWLRAQLDEDERIAREATPGPWRDHGGYVTDVGPDGLPHVQVTDHGTQDGEPEEDNPQGRADSAHIARHDPARVLREIEAKRRIVEIHQVVGGFEDEDMTDLGSGCSECGYSAEYGDRGGWCETLRLLALPYEDRPGYQEEWRP